MIKVAAKKFTARVYDSSATVAVPSGKIAADQSRDFEVIVEVSGECSNRIGETSQGHGLQSVQDRSQRKYDQLFRSANLRRQIKAIPRGKTVTTSPLHHTVSLAIHIPCCGMQQG
ncbi:hypothetical protein J6590_019957 [Homalodisca vitripennis]|nr:hypothetical protein J6590_019957 [Homalodisca vitripennis]